MGMDNISEYRIAGLVMNEGELALRAERMRVALEREERPAPRPVTSTGSMVTVPSTSH
jgi:hypothetical protein